MCTWNLSIPATEITSVEVFSSQTQALLKIILHFVFLFTHIPLVTRHRVEASNSNKEPFSPLKVHLVFRSVKAASTHGILTRKKRGQRGGECVRGTRCRASEKRNARYFSSTRLSSMVSQRNTPRDCGRLKSFLSTMKIARVVVAFWQDPSARPGVSSMRRERLKNPGFWTLVKRWTAAEELARHW